MKTPALVTAVLLYSTIAAAQPCPTVATQPAPAVAAPVPDEEPEGRLGAEIALLPVGSLKASAGGMTDSADTAVALGVGGVLQHPIDEHFTVELAPRVVFHVTGSGDDESATELDLRARVTAGGYVSPQVRLYSAFEPGYSFLFLPDNTADVASPNGVTLGFAVGAAYKVAPKTVMTTEIGYQLGFQKTKIVGMDVDLKANFLHLAVGVLFDL